VAAAGMVSAFVAANVQRPIVTGRPPIAFAIWLITFRAAQPLCEHAIRGTGNSVLSRPELRRRCVRAACASASDPNFGEYLDSHSVIRSALPAARPVSRRHAWRASHELLRANSNVHPRVSIYSQSAFASRMTGGTPVATCSGGSVQRASNVHRWPRDGTWRSRTAPRQTYPATCCRRVLTIAMAASFANNIDRPQFRARRTSGAARERNAQRAIPESIRAQPRSVHSGIVSNARNASMQSRKTARQAWHSALAARESATCGPRWVGVVNEAQRCVFGNSRAALLPQ